MKSSGVTIQTKLLLRYFLKVPLQNFFERSKETIYFVFSILESEERLTMDFQGARDLCPD